MKRYIRSTESKGTQIYDRILQYVIVDFDNYTVNRVAEQWVDDDSFGIL